MDAAARLDRARRCADLLDSAIDLPIVGGVGLDGILGLLPVAGDWITALFSLYIVYQGHKIGLPKPALARMLLVVALDAVVGSVPVVGDLLDIAWKSNQGNVARIEQHLAAKPVSAS
ncbi:DUF4112 domain-containing protein [Halolamina sp.]|jgi:hypothetical protein|uniref:DUF4112 domain-containing protein n=1 Tax=Halolamina sp. TaxID=1940283 RepID=UPI000223B925|nr:hypothetical protein Halar_1496 [halophilic archaeon DL31]